MFHNVLSVITVLLYSCVCVCVCVRAHACVRACVCVKERKERGREIGRVYSTVSSYQNSVIRYFNR